MNRSRDNLMSYADRSRGLRSDAWSYLTCPLDGSRPALYPVAKVNLMNFNVDRNVSSSEKKNMTLNLRSRAVVVWLCVYDWFEHWWLLYCQVIQLSIQLTNMYFKDYKCERSTKPHLLWVSPQTVIKQKPKGETVTRQPQQGRPGKI